MLKRILVGLILVGGLVLLGWFTLSKFVIRQQDNETTQQSVPAENIRVETVADNLVAPWAIDFADNGDVFFTERPGRVRLIQNGNLLSTPLLELPDAPAEGGTLGLALDPNFSQNNHVFVYYTTAEQTNRISRYTFVDQQLNSEQVILDNIPGDRFHNGGRIAFGPDGALYAGTGDASEPALSQDPGSLAGKILRLNPDGTVPNDNPFEGSYVYSLGHRNVQGLAWNEAGELYATEHGQSAQDEINKIEPGANYGWPDIQGNIENEADAGIENYRNPALQSGTTTWAPSGATFYTDNALPDEWRGKFIFAGLRGQALWRFDTSTNNIEKVFGDEYGRLRDVKQAPDGSLYFITSNRDGRGSPAANDDRILRIISE
jgi:aldose sugar dehydrogenase